MQWYWRAASLGIVIGLLVYFTSSVQIIRDGVLWLIMTYLIVGSFTGGIRRVLGEFTDNNFYHRRSALGHSWYVLTMWILRKIVGVTPPGKTSIDDEDDSRD